MYHAYALVNNGNVRLPCTDHPITINIVIPQNLDNTGICDSYWGMLPPMSTIVNIVLLTKEPVYLSSYMVVS